MITIQTLLVLVGAAVCVQVLTRVDRWLATVGGGTPGDYLFKMARITGTSEYDVFRAAAENWPVGAGTIDSDFKAYLRDQTVPYYVTDYIRRNKRHIDAINLNPF